MLAATAGSMPALTPTTSCPVKGPSKSTATMAAGATEAGGDSSGGSVHMKVRVSKVCSAAAESA